MKWSRWIEQPRLLVLLALAFALVPAWLAVVTYRDARQKDERVYETTAQVLAEKMQNNFERHTYFPREVRQLARSLDEAALLAGEMVPAFPWQDRLPHLMALGYARQEEGRIIVRWMSEQRVPVTALGDDLATFPGVVATLKAASPHDPSVTMGCMLEHHRMLILLKIPGSAVATAARGYIIAWIDLDSMCRDPALELIRDQVLAAMPHGAAHSSSAKARCMPIRDGEAKWIVCIQRGAGFSKYDAPAPWLTFITVGLSALPLLLLASLAGRSARLHASLAAEREVLRQQRYFTQSVSHEFRTPLGIIQSGADLLDQYAEHLTPERRREVLGEIRDNTRQMTEMVEQVLELGRMDSGAAACQRKPVNLAALCQQAAERVTKAAEAAHKIEVNAPDTEVMLDDTLMGSLLENLLSNAVKYSAADKSVTLSASLDDQQLSLTLRDEGIGIPADDLPRVCDPFHRCGNVGSTPGSGLGLAIAHRAAGLHGGTLRIESIEGKGTTAAVTIPTLTAS
ncbi:MAG: sensor histidine kinase [Prosthecobacter sp.]|uniref:sensor histidine kinase n=1 Tax=Prosthecobacter sp. TaxID=1965333 RepID=UPI0038FEE013